MQNVYRNIYKTVRETTGITQERAAGLLNVSVESLRAYESENPKSSRIPPDEVVMAMCEAYNAYHLRYQHIKNKSLLGEACIPDVKDSRLDVAGSRVYACHNRLGKKMDHLIEITWNNEISVDEIEPFSQIETEMLDMVSAFYSLISAAKERTVKE